MVSSTGPLGGRLGDRIECHLWACALAIKSATPTELARTQALGWLLDDLFDAEDELLALAAGPEALSGWRRERLRESCDRVGAGMPQG